MSEIDKSEPITAENFPKGRSAHHPLRDKMVEGLFALSLANLCFINAWATPFTDADKGYFNKMRMTQVTLAALLVNLLCFGLMIWITARARRRLHNRWFDLITDFLFFSSLIVPLEFVRVRVLEIPDFQLAYFILRPLNAVLIAVVLGIVVWQHRRVSRVLSVAVGLLSPLALLTLTKAALLSIGLMHLAEHAKEPQPAPWQAIHPGQPRVLWIIFDEMDFRLTFVKPLPRLAIPEFERLKNEAIFATNAFAPGDNTRMSIPALTTGKRFSAVEVANSSDLSVKVAETGEATTWTGLPSIFSQAYAMGFNNAVVGWYHPYDRVFAGYLSFCAWHPIQWFEYVRAAEFGEALKRQLACMACAPYFRYIYGQICQESIGEALSVVGDERCGLTFLHLPPPHRPGVYNPEKDSFTIIPVPKPVAYRNNLMLADRTLGKIRSCMEKTGLWDRTWVIISSDHSWRETPGVDGIRDFRVPFIIKSAGSNAPVVYGPAMNTVVTHDLVLGILRGEITNQTSALTWLDQNRNEQPTVTERKGKD